jgi:CRISPR-associated endonuclease/helicase Cas3
MCAVHRLDLLGLSASPAANNVLTRLRSGQPCWVISTQLIEAGVDVDFPVVFRAMGPLDSIVQAAGRCNREGLLRDAAGQPRRGEVVIFHPADASLPRGIYEKATAIASARANGQAQYLDPERLATDPTLFADYFAELYQLTPTDFTRRGEATIQADRAAFNFRTVAEHARVIREDTVSVFVPYGRVRKLTAKIRHTRRFDRAILRRLQRCLVSVRRGPGSDLEKLEQAGALEPLLPGQVDLPVLGDWCYDRHRGLVIRDRPLEDFIA